MSSRDILDPYLAIEISKKGGIKPRFCIIPNDVDENCQLWAPGTYRSGIASYIRVLAIYYGYNVTGLPL